MASLTTHWRGEKRHLYFSLAMFCAYYVLLDNTYTTQHKWNLKIQELDEQLHWEHHY
jgi:hypothetical protein